MGRYKQYFDEVWQLQSNRKVIALNLFGVIFDNTTPFTPGNNLNIADGVEVGLQMLSQKGYDFLIVTGQPPLRTKNLEINDFENIISATSEIIQKLGGRLKNAYYAPSTDKTDPFVKPNTGMFERAESEGQITWKEAHYLSVESADIKAAAKMGATPVVIRSATNKDLKFKALEMTNNVKIIEFDSLTDYAQSLSATYN
jgi:HAD superfamily hydrolase (TIGR01662 family)